MKLATYLLAAVIAVLSIEYAAADDKRCRKGFEYDPERKMCVRIPRGSF